LTEQPYFAGVMTVAWPLRGRVRMALPPEHRVAAVRPTLPSVEEEWLIEGPLMPAAPGAGVAQPVLLVVAAEKTGAGFRLSGYWRHCPRATWLIGEWPDFEGYRRAMEADDV